MGKKFSLKCVHPHSHHSPQCSPKGPYARVASDASKKKSRGATKHLLEMFFASFFSRLSEAELFDSDAREVRRWAMEAPRETIADLVGYLVGAVDDLLTNTAYSDPSHSESGAESAAPEDGSAVPSRTSSKVHVEACRRLRMTSLASSKSVESMDFEHEFLETVHLRMTHDDVGNKLINKKYTVLALLGKGTYGKVKLAMNEATGERVAIKIVNKTRLRHERDPHTLNREIAILKKLRHRNVVSLYEVIDDPSSQKLYLVMQYIANGPVVQIRSDLTCTPLPEDRVLRITRQAISGMRYLHKRNIIHRDVKPDNLLVCADGTVCFTDFGMSLVADADLDSKDRQTVGTPLFWAPEQASHDVKEHKRLNPVEMCSIGFASDTWSLAVTVYSMLIGSLPFKGNTLTELTECIVNNEMPWTGTRADGTPLEWAEEWYSLLTALLHKDWKKRMTLKEAKHHDIFARLEPSPRVCAVTTAELELACTHQAGLVTDVDDYFYGSLSPKVKNVVRRYVSCLRARVSENRAKSAVDLTHCRLLSALQMEPHPPANPSPTTSPGLSNLSIINNPDHRLSNGDTKATFRTSPKLPRGRRERSCDNSISKHHDQEE